MGVAVGLTLVATLPLMVARVVPLVALAASVAANDVFMVVARLEWPAAAIVAWLVALALSPLWLPRREAVGILAVTGAAVVAAVFVPVQINDTPWDATIAESFAVLAAWWAGENVRARREVRTQLVGTARRLRLLTEQDAVTRERARIARELHDVVAHHVSTIAVRAATLPYEVDDLPPAVRLALTDIADGARAALVDLRAVLGVLRHGDEEADGIPQPRLTDVPSLVARVQATGTPVELRAGPSERPLADSIEVCGYRIIQEALTNAMKHAAGSKVWVDLTYGANELTIRVLDDGTGALPAHESASPATGYGLIGMRERVTMLGGTLVAAPRKPAGFEVLARLPCSAQLPDEADGLGGPATSDASGGLHSAEDSS